MDMNRGILFKIARAMEGPWKEKRIVSIATVIAVKIEVESP